ncbi:hypothetical protein M430DRAFT_188337 [Amorphotheca resinae ATCC 22711]|uniref:Uncharacterized protein n=1 Tax=Amorphotheca resinae ATCC 22711 TaxID=857342 RepID=A0A2T3AQZ8_AMORE|nr:hypothetical protein M430DRAFT_188337 [Amorphotheca resinae ATCC 22711]PSS08695.1 hypothetical protein M430DRAFT_188337 [Amorphotheca resinae ATCC 22711]
MNPTVQHSQDERATKAIVSRDANSITVQHSHDKHRCDVQQKPPLLYHMMLIRSPSKATFSILTTSANAMCNKTSLPSHTTGLSHSYHVMLILSSSKPSSAPLMSSTDAMCNKTPQLVTRDANPIAIEAIP